MSIKRRKHTMSMTSTLLRSILFLGFSSIVFANNGTQATEQVRSVVEQVKGAVVSSKGEDPVSVNKKIRAILEPSFDFVELSKGSLGANWKEATPKQQEEFTQVFSELLARTYLEKIRKYIETSDVSFDEPAQRDDRIVVKMKILQGDDTFHADYRLLMSNGRWRVYDVIIENVGLITNYRSEFSSIIRKEGFDGLLSQLRKRLEKLDQK